MSNLSLIILPVNNRLESNCLKQQLAENWARQAQNLSALEEWTSGWDVFIL